MAYSGMRQSKYKNQIALILHRGMAYQSLHQSFYKYQSVPAKGDSVRDSKLVEPPSYDVLFSAKPGLYE